MERKSKVRHTFKFTNIGGGELTLKAGGTTCSMCTVSQLSKTRLAHGETADVTIEYDSSYSRPQFRQSATILTNDAEQPRVELNIFGSITTKYQVVPDQMVFSKISVNETKTSEIKIYAFLNDNLQVVKHELTGPETAPFFEVHTAPIPKEQLAENPDVKSGCLVTVTVKPGLPLGPVRQTIRLELNTPGEEPLEVPIHAIVDSDISIVGGNGWNADYSRLNIGAVRSAEGATRKLLILVRGPERHSLKVQPVKVNPAWLKVTIGETSELNKDVNQIPLTIEIPSGTAAVNHLGSDQGKYAEILFETTHPQVKHMRMYLQFIVEQ
ncbi:MAG: DUF1573 domain-containing protein [Planctomycetia bacterium]|nr:DUF1573 domain-containing protein [Planctomycetia bacterium]